MRLTLLALALATFGCTSTKLRDDAAPADGSRAPAAASQLSAAFHNLGWGIPQPMPASCSLSCDEVRLWAGVRPPRPGEESQVAHPNTVKQLLELIRERRPDYMGVHTFAFDSFSLQQASFNHPRAVVFGCDARTVLTFNGHPKQKGFERLEMMCFDDPNRGFEFQEITFPMEAHHPLEDVTAAELTQHAVLSPIGGGPGRLCAQCHQTPSRPNWESYNIWPRFYGGYDDYARPLSSPEGYLNWEKAKLAAFMGGNRQKGRYATLPPLKTSMYEPGYQDRPNDAIGTRFYYNNGERIVAELKRMGEPFRRRKYAFAHALYCSAHSPIGQEDISEHTSTRAKEIMLENYDHVSAKLSYLEKLTGALVMPRYKVNGWNDEYFETKFVNKLPPHNFVYNLGGATSASPYNDASEAETIAAIEKVMAPLGVDISNWSLNLNGGHAYGSGQAGTFMGDMQSMLEYPFLRTFMQSDAEIFGLALAFRQTPQQNDTQFPGALAAHQKLCRALARRL